MLYATPSDTAIAKMEQSLRELILPYRGGQKALIDKINQKLTGWASYHKVTEAREAFRHIDNVVKTLLLQLSEELNPAMPRSRIISKYFYLEADGEHTYAMPNKPDVRVIRLVETILIRHRPVGTKMNPYLDGEYYEERTGERAIASVVGKYKPIWVRQNGSCFYCGNPILIDERKTLVPMNPARPENTKNLAYIHSHCSLGQAEFYDSELPVDSDFDLSELLTELSSENRPSGRKHKYAPLIAYFRQRTEAVFTMTFDEIGEIIGEPLCDSALKYIDYWQRRGELKISFSWLSNGYKIQKLHFDTQRVVFERKAVIGEALKIPEVFLNGRVPSGARAELENFFGYIQKKYAL
jgi:hypothetical protein